jgi:hypothetical protein
MTRETSSDNTRCQTMSPGSCGRAGSTSPIRVWIHHDFTKATTHKTVCTDLIRGLTRANPPLVTQRHGSIDTA